MRTHKQASKQTIYVCKTLLYEKENIIDDEKNDDLVDSLTKIIDGIKR